MLQLVVSFLNLLDSLIPIVQLILLSINSLVEALLSRYGRIQEYESERELTDGIDIDTWTVETDEGRIEYSIWDFAGQTLYYNTHQVNFVLR